MIYTYISDTASNTPEKLAIIQAEKQVTYKELNHGVSVFASFLVRNGIQRGNRVGFLGDNSMEYIISCFGVQKAGGIFVPVNPQYSSYEVKKIIYNCTPSTLVVEKKHIKAALEAVSEAAFIKFLVIVGMQDTQGFKESISKRVKVPSHIEYYSFESILNNKSSNSIFPMVNGEDIASIIYTSGTTGKPRGAALTHNNFAANAESIVKYLRLTGDDRVMVVLPFYYSYGFSLLTTHMMVGGSLVLENSFMYPNVILEMMVEESVTGFAGVPSTFAILLNRSKIRDYRFPALRYMTQAGGPMSPGHAKELSEVQPDTEIFIMYGQTEATARLTYLDPADFYRKPGSIGKAIPGVVIELVKENGELAGAGEEGEIVVKGKNVMSGYWNNPEETRKVLNDRKLFTGDLARMDDEGYLYIISRRSDMIKSGAHRISPKEIEEIILEMPEVHEAAVFGINDEILGEAIKAAIVLKGGLKMEAKWVQRHCSKKLASFKIPKEVEFVGELPKTSSGKVQKHLCKKLTC